MVTSVDTSLEAPETSAFYREVRLGTVAGGTETDPLWTPEVGTTQFREALRLSLHQHGYLARPESAQPRYRISAQIIEVRHPMSGFTMTSDASVLYRVEDADSGSLVFEDLISSSGTATVNDAFDGVSRVKMAQERAVQENISSLLKSLSTSKVE
jgi:hypothetical protein